MRVRLRETPVGAELRQMYAAPHDHTTWPDHVIRVDVTVALALGFIINGMTVGDLSCGDAAIPRGIAAQRDVRLVLGDFAPGYEHTGRIEETIDLISPVDVFVCCETLEHLDDPDGVLKQIRAKAGRLVLSTPAGETTDSRNPEHVWGWDPEDLVPMLTGAGFRIGAYVALNLRPGGCMYDFQIWVCR